MQFVRYVQIYSPGQKFDTPQRTSSDAEFQEIFQGIAECLLAMTNVKSLAVHLATTEFVSLASSTLTAHDIDENARAAITPFLPLRILPSPALDINFDVVVEDPPTGVWSIRTEFVQRIREILTTPDGGEAPSIQGLQIMEFDEYADDSSEED